MTMTELPRTAITVPHEPVLRGRHTLPSLGDEIGGVVLAPRAPWGWYVGTTITGLLVLLLLVAVTYLFVVGIGVWGVNIPVAWGMAIGNFVWWIGIGHAGTLISAILLLLRQEWRTSINRFAEAMTLFAVVCAGLYPILHLGRPWFFYWFVPYPATMGIWPQFRSPLVWDFFAVSTYLTVSLLFWYQGLIPDLASLRDRARLRRTKILFGILALGWRGSARHWQRYDQTYYLLAALATPLVVSVHSVVSFDFAVANVPGWHSTIFPPYFVAGALFSGFAMVLTIAIPLRVAYGLTGLITERHLDLLAKLMLASGLVVTYSYLMELFIAWYSANPFEQYVTLNRMFGPYGFLYWIYMLFNVGVIQLIWFRGVRRRHMLLWTISILVNVGMWTERFVIIVESLHRDYVPSSWGLYIPTVWDWATLLGTLGVFSFLLFLFIRGLPMISVHEMRKLLTEREAKPADDRETARAGAPA
jgi:molybdopterin-containing oxidoreductase family membrane subunit